MRTLTWLRLMENNDRGAHSPESGKQQLAETTTVEGLFLVDAGFNTREIPQGGQQIDGSGDRPESSCQLGSSAANE